MTLILHLLLLRYPKHKMFWVHVFSTQNTKFIACTSETQPFTSDQTKVILTAPGAEESQGLTRFARTLREKGGRRRRRQNVEHR